MDKFFPDVVPIKTIISFTKECISESKDTKKISNGNIVLLENSEGGSSNTATIISGTGVRAIITMDKISDLPKKYS